MRPAMATRRSLASAVLALALAGGAVAACGDDAPATPPPATTTNDAGSGGTDAALPLCVDGKPTVSYPPEPYELGILGTVRPGLSFDGPEGPISIESFFEPCAQRSRLLVIRSSAAWCGPCLWHAEHTKRFFEDPRFAGRLVLLDLLVADEENMPATVPALARWREKIDAPGGMLAVDPEYTFGPAHISRAPLPEYVLVDTRTMKIVNTLSDPDPTTLAAMLEIALAELDGIRPPPVPAPALVDGLFTENQMDLLRGMSLTKLGPPPPDPTNEYGDVPAAAAFGKVLFNDVQLSPSGNVSCAKCHDPGQDFTDGVPQAVGVETGDRNSPGIALAAHSRWQFWDGRADTLWMQALGPFENPKEFGGSRLFVAHQIAQHYSEQYGEVFAKYPLPDLSGLPPAGKPGDADYDKLSAPDKVAVTRVFVNVGKAIAAFERTLRVKPNALDRYADGDVTALTPAQKRALSMFFQNGCVQCHWGPRLTDDAFHVLRFPTGRQDGKADVGRVDGLLELAASEFRASSTWSDAPSAAKPFVVDAPTMLGAFKTPSLRGLPTSAPYGHGGMLKTLSEVAEKYGNRGLEHADPLASGTTEQWVPNFDANIVRDLPAFLEVLTGTVEVP